MAYSLRPSASSEFEMPQEQVTLACTECQRRNYNTSKNKKNVTERLELRRYCKWCRKHTPHKETK